VSGEALYKFSQRSPGGGPVAKAFARISG